MMLTALGRVKDVAMPLRPRKRMSSRPVREAPAAAAKATWRRVPKRYMTFAPKTSHRDPAMRRREPQVRALIDTGLWKLSVLVGGIDNMEAPTRSSEQH